MKQRCIIFASCFLILALLIPLCSGCGGGKEEQKVITIGYLTDYTGPASEGCRSVNYALEDVVQYYNEEGLIPGTKITIADYDTQWNPSRVIPGYEWSRGRGAQIVFNVVTGASETLKPFLERDTIPVVSISPPTMDGLEQPGWVLVATCPGGYGIKTLLKWISEERWDYSKGIPKTGCAGWDEADTRDTMNGMKEYSQAHPDKFEWVGGFLEPLGSMTTWSGELAKLKDCDFIHGPGSTAPLSVFFEQWRARGYSGKFIGCDNYSSVWGWLVNRFGYEALDGWLTTTTSLWWSQSFPMVDLAQELLGKYRSGQAESIVHSGNAYVGAVADFYALFDIVKQTVAKLGAEHFGGQAFRDGALEYRTEGSMWEGYPEWGFVGTRRYMIGHWHVYEWDAEAKDLVCVSDWLPVVE